MEIEPDELSKTPQELINMLKIEHMSFENPQSSYQSLTHFVNQITKQYRCPMSADCTGIYRKNQIYRCRFGGKIRGKSPKTNCPCYVTFMRELDGSYTFSDAFWYHNHEINSETFDAHFCTLTTDELNKVQDQKKMGVPPGQIRANLGVNMNSRNFYHYRHNAILNLKNETLIEFKKKTVFSDYDRLIIDPGNVLSMAIFFHRKVAFSSYGFDAITIDDTSKINIYDLPLEIIVTVDQEGKSQLLGFALLPDKTSDSYQTFFQEVKKFTQKEPRIIFLDRSSAQLSAIRAVYPSSIIVFSRVHLRRDLLTHFDSNDPIIQGFDDINVHVENCSQYIDLLQERFDSPDEDKKGIIKDLLDTQEH